MATSSVVGMDEAQREVEATAVLAASTAAVRQRRLAEVRDLEVLAQWAELHASDPTARPGLEGELARRFGDVLQVIGGLGTPAVQQLSLGEIAVARSAGVTATRNAMADVLDLIHRLPLTWQRCADGEAEVWVARKIATLSRHLGLEEVDLVDAACARIIDREGPGRVLSVAEAKVIEADPVAHAERMAAGRSRRFVGFGRTDEDGLRMVIARVTAGDAMWIQATLARVVEIITPDHPGATADELRSIAFGWLGRPAEMLALLLEHTESGDTSQPDHPDDPDVEETATTPVVRPLAFPADLLDALRRADLARLRPRSVVYVHLHEAAVTGTASGTARVEGLGPMALADLAALLGHTQVVVKPVIDLSDRVRHTAYEHPESLKERVFLEAGGDYFPYATSTSRHVDYDHVTEYDDTGPPGQTGTHNAGPLGRHHHRLKTHRDYRARQAGDGRYAWLTPHGLGFLVDHTGTRRVDPELVRAIIDAPSGVDLYPTAS